MNPFEGIDEVACTAVNDSFVRAAWSKATKRWLVRFLADVNVDSRAIGLDTDSSAYGMGQRGQRYAMIVNDGVVEQLHVEAPGEFKVSSADYLVDKL